MKNNGYPSSVKPGIPRFDKIPHQWKLIEFGNIFVKHSRKVDLDDDKTYQLIVAKRNRGGIVSRTTLSGKQIKTKNQYYVKSGDFVISKRQIVHGACGVVPKELDGSIVSNEYLTLQPNLEVLLPTYQNYLANAIFFQQSAFQASVGVDIEKMIFRWEDFSKYKALIPPIKQQQKISKVISSWDEVINTMDDLIKRKEILLNSLLSSTFNPNSINETFSLGSIGIFSKGKGISKNEVKDSGLPCVRYGELYTEYQTAITQTKSYINEESARFSQQISSGDILIAGSGESAIEIGKSAVYQPATGYAGGDIIIFTPDVSRIDNRFLSFQLNSPFLIKQRAKLAQGNSVVHIYKNHLEGLEIFVPTSIAKQKELANLFDLLESSISLLIMKKKLLLKQKMNMMQQLLTGKVITK